MFSVNVQQWLLFHFTTMVSIERYNNYYYIIVQQWFLLKVTTIIKIVFNCTMIMVKGMFHLIQYYILEICLCG